jgi:hypothetical protein
MGPALPRRTWVVGGLARLPKELSSGEALQVVVELDADTGKVMEASLTPSMPVIEKLLRELLIGMDLETGVNDFMEAVERRLHHRSKKAVLAAVRDLVMAYREGRYGASGGREGS